MSRTEYKYNFYTMVKLWCPWGEVKRSIIIKFQSQRFLYQVVCMFSQKEDIKHIDWTIHSVACVMHWWCDLGMQGSKTWEWRFALMMMMVIIIIITYCSGLDTDVEKRYTIFIVNVNSLKFPLTLIHTSSLCSEQEQFNFHKNTSDTKHGMEILCPYPHPLHQVIYSHASRF